MNRITTAPENSKSCLRDMRRSVDIIIDMLGSDITADQIIEDHTELKKEDIPASLNCE